MSDEIQPTVDLLPCPFCGSEAAFDTWTIPNGCVRKIVRCLQWSCGAMVEDDGTGMFWNKRHGGTDERRNA